MSSHASSSRKKSGSGFKFLIVLVLVVVAYLVFKDKISPSNNDGKKTTNSGNNSVVVADTTAPELKLDFDKTVAVVGQEYKVKGTANDDVDGDITSRIQFEGLDTSKEGKYEVNVFVSDNAGNKTEKKQTVIVRGEISNGLPVLMYHFFYDNVKYTKKDSNWLNVNDFEKQIKYMTENDFYFPSWEEVNDYIDGKIKLPSKSVVLTVDDGDPSFFEVAVPVLQKYNVPATSFVITDWYAGSYNPEMKCVVWESHSACMHEAGANGKGRMVNWSYDQIVEDLKVSSAALGNANVFCYPFGHYNDTAIKALKDTDYIMAFTIEGGRVFKGADKYKLPRVRVADGNSLDYFIKSIS